MAYGLKYYFVDKKIVGSTSTTYTFEIHEEDYTGSSTEWTGISIDRNYEQFSLRKINYIQKSSCKGLIRVQDSSQRSVIETIAGSEIGKYKVILKRDTDTIWTGLVVPDLIEISEQNYGNQSATIVAKDIFLVGDYALSTSRTKAIDIIIDILNTMGYELDVYTFTSWVETSQPSGSDILSVSYHEERRIRKFGRTDDEVDQAISNQQALEYMLKTYGAMLRQSDGAWNIIQISAFEEPSAVRRFRYDYTKTLQSAELDYQLGAVSTGSDLKVFGSSSNNFFAGLKKVKSEFKHESTIQGIKFNRQYWFEDTNPLTKTQFWQADGTGNLEFSFVTWLARNTSGNVDLGGNTVVAEVTIQCGTYYFNGSSWAETPATIDVEVEDVFSTTDSNGYYIHKNQGISIVTDPIPNGADGQLSVTVDPKDLILNYEYLFIRDVNFDLAYSDNAEGVSSSIRHELISDLNFSEEYDFGTYYFGSGPSEASLSAIKDSSGNLLATFKRSNELPTDTHEELLLREILDLRRTQKRSIRAVLYGEYEPISVINYDSQRFFFFGGTWSSKTYQWNATLAEYDIERPSDVGASDDTLDTYYETNGAGFSSAVSGSTSTSTGSGSIYLEKGRNLADLIDDATARSNLGVQIGLNVQGWDADLDDISALSSADGNIIVGSASGWTAESGGTARASLGLTIGTNVQAHSDQLDDFSSLTPTDGNVIVGNGSTFVTESGSTARTSLGLGSSDNVSFNNITSSGTVFTDNIDTVDITWNTSEQEWDATPSEYFNNPLFIGTTLDVAINLEVDGYANIGTDLDVGGNSVLIGSLSVSGSTTIGGSLTLTGSADFNSAMNLQGNLTTQSDLQDDGFSEGWSGTNWKIGADGSAEFEEMRIRGALRVYEFIAKQISTVGGSEILSIAQGRVESTSGGDTITVENVSGTGATSFKSGDLWIVQVVDVNNDLESGGTGSVVKSVRGSVTSVSGNDLSIVIDAGSIDQLEQGDLIVAYGNSSDEDRQSIMYRNVDRSEDNLIMRLQTGVNNFSALQSVSNTRVAFGDLNGYSGLNSETFGFFAGDNSDDHVLIADSGIFFKNGSTIGAQLSSNIFKIGNDTKYLSFNTNNSEFLLATDKFNLTTSFIQIANSLDHELTSSVNYDTTSFDGLFFDADNYIGHIDDVDVVATSGFALRIGGNTSNFMEVNEGGGIAKINFDTFTLDTGSGSGIKIESDPDPLIQLSDASRVRTQIDITSGSPTISDTTELSVITSVDSDANYVSSIPYFQVPEGDAIEVYISAELADLTNAGGGSYVVYLYGGTSSTSATNLIAQKRSQIFEVELTTADFYLTGYSYDYDYFKIEIEVQIVDPDTVAPPNVNFVEFDIDMTVKSYESQTRIALDGVYVNNDTQQYARLTRSGNVFGGITKLQNIPTADPEIAGALWNSGGTIKISSG